MTAPGVARSRWHAPARAALTVCAALSGACNAPGGSPGRQPPRIAFGETSHDGGRVRQGDPVIVTFPFRNAGDLPLVLDTPRAGCDCEATTSARTLAPGAEGTVTVRCNPAQSGGPFSGSATVYGNDPAQPATTLTVTADVQAVAVADPARVFVGHVQRGKDAAAVVKLLAPAEADTTFGPVEGSGRVLRAALAPLAPRDAPADMRGQMLRLGITPDAPLGPFAATLRIATSSRLVPAVTVEVAGRVDGTVVATPARLEFGRVAADGEATRVVEVRRTTDRAVAVSGARMEPPVGRVEVAAVRPGRTYRVTVRLEGSAARPMPAGRVEGTIVIDTDTADLPRLEVPFTARVVTR